MSYIRFGSVDTATYGIEVFAIDVDRGARRIYTEKEVPGRNGTLKFDMKRYANIPISYTLVAYSTPTRTAEEAMTSWRNDVLSLVGYQKLEDSFHPEFFYEACYQEDFKLEFSPSRNIAKVKLEFDRKPERYLVTGNTVTTITGSTPVVLENDTNYDAKPLIRVYGNGDVSVGERTITIAGATGTYIDIDCDLMECYEGVYNRNNLVTLSDGQYLVLVPGNNSIALDGPTRVEITPRWYCI